MLADFLTIILFVFFVSMLVLLLATRSPTADPFGQTLEQNGATQPAEFGVLEELAEAISHDQDLLAREVPLHVPHIELPGVKLGGGAVDEPCSTASGMLLLELNEDPNEKRKYNRRLVDRRRSDVPISEEQRTVQRRVWLRREEDRSASQLLTVVDAADTLGVPVENIYKWLDEEDIPFYQITEDKQKTIRFEINEVLQWYSTFAPDSGGHRKHT